MKTNKIVFISMMLAMSIVLASVEMQLNFDAIPGVKLGLPNIIVLLVLYKYGAKEGFLISMLRVIIVSLLFGKFLTPTFYMSLFGAMFSYIIMLFLIKLTKLSILTISAMGSLFHALGQICAASIFLNQLLVFYYYPFIGLLSLLTGILTGLLAYRIIKHFEIYFNEK